MTLHINTPQQNKQNFFTILKCKNFLLSSVNFFNSEHKATFFCNFIVSDEDQKVKKREKLLSKEKDIFYFN